MRVLNANQMREADRRTIEGVGIPAAVLMEHAGRAVIRAMDDAFGDIYRLRIGVLCGRGNNGGDGFVIARELADRGVQVRVYLLGHKGAVLGDARMKLEALELRPVEVTEIIDQADWNRTRNDVIGRDLIVDALFGTGLARPLDGIAATMVTDVNASHRPVIAVDLPSGLSADTADVAGTAIRASLTVAFAAPKVPLVFPPASAYAGRLVVADIGIPASVIEALEGPRIDMVTAALVRPLVLPRRADAHKGEYGRLLIVAGSPGKTGAASLAAISALRSGAGLVTIACPRSSSPIIAALAPEYMTLALDEGADGTLAASAADAILGFEADVIAIGPGLGHTASTTKLVHALVERAGVPLVLDADGLNVFAGEPDRLGRHKDNDVIITPHPGEMARLTGLSIHHIQAHRLDVAQKFAAEQRVHVVLKGQGTVIAAPDGRVWVNSSGNPGMATAGSGDVLTGAIAAWRGQIADTAAAVRLGVYLHGHAGDIAVRDVGEVALIASDIVSHLGAAVLDLAPPEPRNRAFVS